MPELRGATVTTRNVEDAVSRYREWLGYVVVESGEVDDGLAASWGAPVSFGRSYALLQPASGAPVFLRFVEGSSEPGYQPLRTYGWAAIELCVSDTLAVNERLEGSPFRIIGAPRELDTMPAIFPMQVEGPDQEILYLTQIRDDPPEYDLPRAGSLVDRLFIVVLACADLERSMRWFERTLGLRLGSRIELEYRMLSRAFSLPQHHRHVIATAGHRRECFLELDQYPSNATPRPGSPGALKPGIALATFAHPDLGEIPPDDWISPPRVRPGLLYDGQIAGTLCAPDGTLVEVVQST